MSFTTIRQPGCSVRRFFPNWAAGHAARIPVVAACFLMLAHSGCEQTPPDVPAGSPRVEKSPVAALPGDPNPTEQSGKSVDANPASPVPASPEGVAERADHPAGNPVASGSEAITPDNIEPQQPEIRPEDQFGTQAGLIDAGLIDPDWKRLDPVYEIWLDTANKNLILGGQICFREGYLEVFACPRGTKEHESVVSVNCSARNAHAALLALGANPGHPADFMDGYKPASGPVIRIDVAWMEDGKKVLRRAQELVLSGPDRKMMEQDWVFGGSQIFTDEVSGEVFYSGDGGEFICLSNFTTATLDLPIASSESNAELMFQANTDRIPELGHRVILILKPDLSGAASRSPDGESATPQMPHNPAEGGGNGKPGGDSGG